jgi:saccharopine dehydrogenase (NAD+, L-lysine-forming)
MHTLKLGLIREGKVPPDKRVPFSPAQVEEIKQRFPNINVVCQESATRCFSDEEYRALDIEIVKDVSDCDILMGIKEVPIDHLIPNKTLPHFLQGVALQPQ